MASNRDEKSALAQLNSFANDLMARCNACCELCNSANHVAVFEVPPIEEPSAEKCVVACDACQSQIRRESELDANHWKCLLDSAWSQIPAVQVLAWRQLKRLDSNRWAQDLLEQLYLDEPTLAWAQESDVDDDSEDPTFDSNGARLSDGDTVQIIKDLDVKGAGFVAKRGTVVKNIRLTSNPELVDGRVNKTAIVLKTCFLKKTS